MKRYRYITLSLLLLLLSLSTLSAQETSQQGADKDINYQFEVTTTPSYCQNEGTMEVKLLMSFGGVRPSLSQIEKVEYDVKDGEGYSYTGGYKPAPAPTEALRLEQLPGRDDYHIFIRLIPKEGVNERVVETFLRWNAKVENKYVALEVTQEKFDAYRLPCRPYGSFHIIARGGTQRPPVLNIKQAPDAFTGAKTMQPTKREVKGDTTYYHFEYSGALPQGTYEYTLNSPCRDTYVRSFDVYGPTTNLPTVPSDLKIPFVVSQMERKGCEGKIFEFAASSSDKPFLRTLFEAINKGYQGKADELFPEFVDSFPSIFMANYEVVVVSQQEYAKLQQGKLDASTLLWSDQKGSLTTLTGGRGKGDPTISYKLPQAVSLQELRTQQALPGALLIRVKRPNEGCNEYITIPVSVDLDFRGGASFRTLEAEDLSDCSLGQIVWFQAWNFCTLRIKYYELPDGADKPAPGAQPVHTSDDFGPAVSTMVEKQYTFAGYDPTKRYYVELDITDLYGNSVTPKPSLILSPKSKTPIENRLYNFSSIYSRLSQFFAARSFVGDHITFLSPTSGTYLAMSTTKDNYNPIRGMEITLVQAPEGYEEFQRVREDFYFRKPDPSNQSNPYGGGMIRLGETIRISNDYRLKGLQSPMGEVFPFHFIYKEGKNGERVVYSYTNWNVPTPLKEPFVEPDAELEQYFWDHPMPKGIYRFKFEHPCQPGESFYIDLDMSEPDFKPELTDLIEPVVDRTSCDEVRVYPFADGRLDYAVDKEGKPRNLIFYATVNSNGIGKEWLYFFPYDRSGKPIDHTKFYIPFKKTDLPLTLNLRYFYPRPDWQWIEWHKTTSTSVDPIGVKKFVEGELKRKDVSPSYYKLPLPGYDPTDDQKDWGQDGFSGAWSNEPFIPWISVDVPIDTKDLTPSYARPTYVGYRCSKVTGYMEFKLINIPNKVGTVVLKDGDKVIMSSNIEDLPEDLMVKWELNAESPSELKNEYRLEIKTSLCGETNMQTEKFTVKLEDISEGIAVTVSPKGAHCPGDVVTLTATNLGVPDSAYKWTFDNGDTDSGRTIRRKVSAPRVVNGKAHYESYTLTVDGTRCGTATSKGIIPVSPDELWWKPDLDGHGSGTLPSGPDEDDKPIKPDPAQSISKYYDWHNPDNWSFLHERKFYPAKAVPTRCTNVHIEQLSKLDMGTQGTVSPQPDLAKDVTPRDLYGEPTCIDITFHSGAYVYNIQQLNYRRAMVRYNFGVAPDYKSDKYIYTDKEHDTDEWVYDRNALNLLAAPLYDIYAGDYSFSASPYTYQLGFKAVPGVDKNDQYNVATFDSNAFNDPSPLQSISMAGNNNCIALIVAGDERGFKSREGKSTIVERRGILELPYFDRPDIANSFYHQTYDASTGQTRFQYFDGKAKRFRGYYSYAQRSKMAYRFIFEDPTTQRIPKLAGDAEVYTMEVNATAAGQEVMVGNPFMAPLEVVPFLEANKDVIEPYVRLLYPVDVKRYDPKLTLEGSITTYYPADAKNMTINQLEAFVVKLKPGVGPKAQLVFPTSALDSYAKQHPQSRSSLRSTSGDATAETARYLSLTLQSRLGKDRALVAYGYESGSVDKMLLSTESRYPSIAIIDPAGGSYKDLYADDAATGHYELATRVSEPIDVTLSLAGSVMGHVVTARLIDHKSGLEHDLTGGKSCQIKLFPDDREGRLELRVDGDFTSVAPMVEPTDELQAQYSEGMLTVRTTQEMSSLRLVQGDGITVYTQSLPGLTEYSERILLSSGSYVVEAIGTDGVARRAMLVVR